MPVTKKTLSGRNPFPEKEECYYTEKAMLPCSWITCQGCPPGEPSVMEFSLDFTLGTDAVFMIHVSADQHYLLFVDGVPSGRGTEMKSPANWLFESYELSLGKGARRISALVWNYGKLSPANRMSVSPGFFLAADGVYMDVLGTGLGNWKTRKIRRASFQELKLSTGAWMSVPPHEIFDASIIENNDWLAPSVGERGWNGLMLRASEARCLSPSHRKDRGSEWTPPGKAVLISDRMPADGFVSPDFDRGETDVFNAAFNKSNIIIPARSEKRVILELDNYHCAFSKLKVRGGRGSSVRITWAEAAFTDPEKPQKSDRGAVIGKWFRGVWDQVILSGDNLEWSPLSWRCGRFIEMHAATADEPLTIESFLLKESRWPLEPDASFICDDETVNDIVPLCVRTLQMSAHDNFVDCPFYEQLLYSGDGRLEALVTLVSCKDDTLVRNALSEFARSRDIDGLIMARWPSAQRQRIPSFSLWWIGMLYDYTLWRDDKAFVRTLMPAARGLLELFLSRMDDDMLLRGLPLEWNFIDWVDEWHSGNDWGTPPGINGSVNASYNWLFVYILGLMEKLEFYAGEKLMAERWGGFAEDISRRLEDRFWRGEKGMFAEDDTGEYFSEHAQILAALSGRIDSSAAEGIKNALLNAPNLAKSSIFYKHYLFEAFKILGAPGQILKELALWDSFIAKGFKTVPETPENKTFNQRSDCHGWGSHPLYHLLSNIAGIKPAELGFKKVVISPSPGHLSRLSVKCVSPRGIISMQYEKNSGSFRADIDLPEGLSGVFCHGNQERPLLPGGQSVIGELTAG
jgi:hypothetical protein